MDDVQIGIFILCKREDSDIIQELDITHKPDSIYNDQVSYHSEYKHVRPGRIQVAFHSDRSSAFWHHKCFENVTSPPWSMYSRLR